MNLPDKVLLIARTLREILLLESLCSNALYHTLSKTLRYQDDPFNKKFIIECIMASLHDDRASSVDQKSEIHTISVSAEMIKNIFVDQRLKEFAEDTKEADRVILHHLG